MNWLKLSESSLDEFYLLSGGPAILCSLLFIQIVNCVDSKSGSGILAMFIINNSLGLSSIVGITGRVVERVFILSI